MLDRSRGGQAAMTAPRERSDQQPARKRRGNPAGAAVGEIALWLFDFDNTLALLEAEVDWAASRRRLEAFLRKNDAPGDLFDQFPSGNLLLYDALRSRLLGNGVAHDPAAAAAAILKHASAIIEQHELQGRRSRRSDSGRPGSAALAGGPRRPDRDRHVQLLAYRRALDAPQSGQQRDPRHRRPRHAAPAEPHAPTWSSARSNFAG